MPAPPVVPVFNSTNPAALAGYQNVKPHDVGTAPVDPIVFSVPNTGGAVTKTGSYNAAIGDCGQTIVFNSGSAVTYTLLNPPPTIGANIDQWSVFVVNEGAGVLTISPNGLNINNAASLPPLAQGSGAYLSTDGTNYFAMVGSATTPISFPIATKTANYTVLPTDYSLMGDTTTAGFTFLLPAAPTTNEIHRFKKIDATFNILTIDGNGKNIDNAATQIIQNQYDSIEVQYDGTAWWVW